MWDEVKNLDLKRTTSPFTRSHAMRVNGTKDKEAQGRKSLNTSKVRGSNLREICEERGSFQWEPAHGRC